MAIVKVLQDKPAGVLRVVWGEGSKTGLEVPGVRGHFVISLDAEKRPVGIEYLEFRPPDAEADVKVETDIIQGEPLYGKAPMRQMKRTVKV